MDEREKEIAKFLGKGFKAPAYTTIRNTFLGMDTKELEKLQREWIEGSVWVLYFVMALFATILANLFYSFSLGIRVGNVRYTKLI